MLIKGGKVMKKAVKRLLVLFLALTFIVTDLAVAPVTAQAAGTLKFHKSIALMKGEEIGYVIINSVSSDKVLGLKSSNTSVVSVKKMPFLDDYTLTLKAKKTGTSIISFKVKRKNGKNTFYYQRCEAGLPGIDTHNRHNRLGYKRRAIPLPGGRSCGSRGGRCTHISQWPGRLLLRRR